MRTDPMKQFVFPLFLLWVPYMASCSGKPPSQKKEPPTVKKIQKEVLKGNNKNVFRLAKKYLNNHPDGSHAGEAWLRIGRIQFLFQKYDRAMAAVEKGLKKNSPPWVHASLLQLKGQIYSKKDAYRKALNYFQKTKSFIREDPDAEKWIDYPYLLYRIGYAWIRTRKFVRGKELWEEIVEKYPDSPAAREIKNKKLPFFQQYFSVQIGAFLQRKNAEKLKDKLEQSGYNPYIVRVNRNGKIFHCVREGRYQNYKLAKKKATQLKRDGNKVYIIP